MSAATPVLVWWCRVHDSMGGGEPGTVAAMVGCFAASVGHGDPDECQHERMKMVPYTALVVERDAEGNWPAEIIEQARKVLYTEQWAERWIEALFDALAARRDPST